MTTTTTPAILTRHDLGDLHVTRFRTRFGSVEWFVSRVTACTCRRPCAGDDSEVIFQGDLFGARLVIRRELGIVFHGPARFAGLVR